MADLVRTAKYAKDWSPDELVAYNIDIAFQNTTEFFGGPLPIPSVHNDFLTSANFEDADDETSCQLLAHMEYATIGDSDSRNISNIDLVQNLFYALGYGQRQLVRTRKEVTLFICGEYKRAILDVCIIYGVAGDIGLVFQDGTHIAGDKIPYLRARLVAKALAVFQYNNSKRLSSGLSILDSEVIPGIIMNGTAPSFFKIPVTKELAQAVEHGTFPASRTTVIGHVPDIPRPDRRLSEGMLNLVNCRAFFQCLEAFRQFLV